MLSGAAHLLIARSAAKSRDRASAVMFQTCTNFVIPLSSKPDGVLEVAAINPFLTEIKMLEFVCSPFPAVCRSVSIRLDYLLILQNEYPGLTPNHEIPD